MWGRKFREHTHSLFLLRCDRAWPGRKFHLKESLSMASNSLTSWLNKDVKARRRKQPRLRVEHLEQREAPAIFTVTWDGLPMSLGGPAEPNDGIAMTLQQAITASNNTPGPNQIN